MGRPPKRLGERLSKNRTFRVRGDLDTLLTAAAQSAARSVSEEIEFRLERSFAEERALGGREMRELTDVMRANFAFIGKQAARAEGHADWTAKEWLANQNCYRTAALHVCRTLIEGLPNPSPEEIMTTLEMLKNSVAANVIRSGKIDDLVGLGFIKPKDAQS